MEVLDLNYCQFFFTTNSLRHQPGTSLLFQPLALRTIVLVAATIECALTAHYTGKKARVMISQDEYWGTFCYPPVIKFILKATAFFSYSLEGTFIPHSSVQNFVRIGAPESLLASLPSISLHPPFLILQCSSGQIATPQSTLLWVAILYFILCSVPPLWRTSAGMGTPRSELSLVCIILYSIPLPCMALLCWNGPPQTQPVHLKPKPVLLNSQPVLCNPQLAPLNLQVMLLNLQPALLNPQRELPNPQSAILYKFLCSLSPIPALLHGDRHPSILIGAPLPAMALLKFIPCSILPFLCWSILISAPQLTFALFYFNLVSSITFSVLLFSTQTLLIWHSIFLCSCFSYSSEYSTLLFTHHFDSQIALILLHHC